MVKKVAGYIHHRLYGYNGEKMIKIDANKCSVDDYDCSAKFSGCYYKIHDVVLSGLIKYWPVQTLEIEKIFKKASYELIRVYNFEVELLNLRVVLQRCMFFRVHRFNIISWF